MQVSVLNKKGYTVRDVVVMNSLKLNPAFLNTLTTEVTYASKMSMVQIDDALKSEKILLVLVIETALNAFIVGPESFSS